ncbi:DUF6924 domain-containing protein [Propionibacteriaceae bacterium Y2011]|uniref:DUF6924 domain-containing protein n=1 Tax=Microlunatus sp. Y2014 TaxID=3418488 RepID=UPI003D4C3E73
MGEALNGDDAPILAVWLPLANGDDDDAAVLGNFRVLAAELWSVENNINLANMDWWDFAEHTDDDGVHRGFG